MTETADLIIWDPRQYNSYADHVANVALDLKSDWEESDEESWREARARKANIRLCCDGARRGCGQSAAGMVILAYYLGARKEVLLRSGKLLGNLSSAFLAEMLALEWSLEVFVTRMDK